MHFPKSNTLRAALVAAALLVAPAINAQDHAAAPLPAEKTQGNVTYLSGGIGHDEALAFRQLEPNYPLGLEFITIGAAGAEFLANVNVTITDRQGNVVLQTVSPGPLLFARLPDGSYKVTATAETGARKERNVVIAGRKHEHVVFQW
jgi:hypothetical protein